MPNRSRHGSSASSTAGRSTSGPYMLSARGPWVRRSPWPATRAPRRATRGSIRGPCSAISKPADSSIVSATPGARCCSCGACLRDAMPARVPRTRETLGGRSRGSAVAPEGDPDLPARPQHPERLDERGFAPAPDSVDGDGGVERLVGPRQPRTSFRPVGRRGGVRVPATRARFADASMPGGRRSDRVRVAHGRDRSRTRCRGGTESSSDGEAVEYSVQGTSTE